MTFETFENLSPYFLSLVGPLRARINNKMSEYNYNKRMYYVFFKRYGWKTFIFGAILNLLTKPEVVITCKVTCALGHIKPDKMTS